MEKWELARYIIDAKKCVDSLFYIFDNLKLLSNLDVRKIVNERKSIFYLNLCFVLDSCFKNKKEICQKNKTVKAIYYNRDKNIAHKDNDFNEMEFDSIESIAITFQKYLNDIFGIIKPFMPSELTLNFIRYDRDLFRFINKINSVDEEIIKKQKYPNYAKPSKENNLDTNEVITKKVFQDIDDWKRITSPNDYTIIFDAGLNKYELLQNVQDSCIKTNVLYNQNMWFQIDQNMFNSIEQLKKYKFMNQYEILNYDQIKKNEALFLRIMDGEMSE